MYLGLDLRGGVHFMLQVDMQAALTKKAESYAGDLRTCCATRTSATAASAATATPSIRVRDEPR
jgi:preprotein translocase subunit SecD